MKRLMMLLFVAILAMPLLAQEEPKPEPTIGEEVPPPAEEVPAEDPQNEALVEMKNVLDALNRLKITGYLQAQYVDDESSQDSLGGSTGTRNRDQFSVRRARVKFTWQATSTSRFVLQPDITSSGVTLKDGYVELTEPWTLWKHTLTAGQFNWPFGFEIMYSSSQREVPERSRVVRTLFPGERDRGVMLSGRTPNEKFNYRVALVNGTGTGRSDDLNERKDVVGRVGYSFGAVDVGASVYRGTDLIATSTVATGVEFDKQRQGIDVQWVTPVPGLGVRGEYMTGKQAPAAGTNRTESFDVEGWYLYAIQSIGTKHQLAVRLDEYDSNTDSGGSAIRTINPSYIFHWDAHSKVMASYEWIESQGTDPDDNIFTLRYQFSF
ncbi:MAG TPA: porin [Thermoanaerobaculia bacterium]|nr:porin [Thermoanaerobaculia bacterium]